jgi:hypothetical protein
MQVDEDLWANHQYQVIVSFIHHLAYYRVLKRCYNMSRIESEFWTRTIDAHLLRAVTDWCMVFGADSNQIHWKKVVVDDETQCHFRSHLLSIIDFTKEQWDNYWSDMTTFRNNFAAHRIVAPVYPTVPLMDMALLVATTYDHWVRSSIAAVFEEPSLKARYDRLMRVSGETFLKLVGIGPTVEVEYEGSPPPRA